MGHLEPEKVGVLVLSVKGLYLERDRERRREIQEREREKYTYMCV